MALISGKIIKIAENKRFREKTAKKYDKNAGFVIRHAADGKLYRYDIINIKKETSTPLKPQNCTVTTYFLC